MIIGSHVSFKNQDQLLGSVKEALSYDANTFMFYTGSTQSTSRGVLNDDLTYQAYSLMVENNINSENVIVHAPYIINLANRADEDKYMFYVNFFKQELARVDKLGFNIKGGELLIKNGAIINTKIFGKTPLHIAAKNNSKEIGEILISKGADINAYDVFDPNMIRLFLIKII